MTLPSPKGLDNDSVYDVNFSVLHQKSVFECWLSVSEKQELIQKAYELIKLDEDRFVLFLIHNQLPVTRLGKSKPPVNNTLSDYFIT